MTLRTPFGPAWATIDSSGALTAFGFGDPSGRSAGDNPEVARQVAEYFAGTRTEFRLPLAPRGTPFQQAAWAELCRIPFGSVITYTELAARLGRPNAPRAAGRANATNPIALIIPCHRVIGTSGSLTGYAYGIELKQQLLKWEASKIKSPCTNL